MEISRGSSEPRASGVSENPRYRAQRMRHVVARELFEKPRIKRHAALGMHRDAGSPLCRTIRFDTRAPHE